MPDMFWSSEMKRWLKTRFFEEYENRETKTVALDRLYEELIQEECKICQKI